MTDLKILYAKIYSDNETKNPKRFIDIYEENKTLIEGADNSTTSAAFDKIMRITSDYALSLSNYGSLRNQFHTLINQLKCSKTVYGKI